jgi:hypothetical protein
MRFLEIDDSLEVLKRFTPASVKVKKRDINDTTVGDPSYEKTGSCWFNQTS